jgi:anti-anti-sigma factor
VLTVVEGAVVVRLRGQVLDADYLRPLVQMLDGACDRVIWLDLGGVRLPTAEALGLLIRLNGALRAGGGKLTLVNVPADVYGAFEATRLVGVLDVRPPVAV